MICISKLVDRINLDLDFEYSPKHMMIYLDASFNKTKLFNLETIKLSELKNIEMVNQIFKLDLYNFDFKDTKFYIICITNKLTQVRKQYKSITATIKKLKKVHTNLWESYDPSS